MKRMNDIRELFEKELETVTSELNRKHWLPFVSKGDVMRLLNGVVSRLTSSYRSKLHEDNMKTIDRMNELDTLYLLREEEREAQFREHLEKQKEAIILASSKAFCQGVCPERAKGDSVSFCICQRRNRYAKHLKEFFDEYMDENADKIVNEYKESPKWKSKNKK